MDLIYTVSRKSGFKGHHYDECKHFSNHCKHLIRVSSSNIVAWVTQYDLNDATNTLTGSQVYISDFNMPWNYYKVTSNKGIITTLEWDLHGDYLLIGDDSGTVSIWSYKDHVFNDWICIGSSDFHGEYIIAGTFFHSGRKISLINEKRESFLYYEKFKLDRFFPTVRAKGGTPIDGCFVITSTGMIAALLIPEEVETQSLTTVVDIIASTRYRIAVVDICYRNNGHLVVAASSGCQNMPIQCYDIAIQYVNEKVTHINSQHLPGFFLDGVINSNNMHLRVSGLKFVIREAADLLIVVISTKSGGSVIQVWQLVDGPYYFNNLVGENSYLEEFKTISWRCQTSVTFDSDVISLTTPKLLINNCIPPSFHILAAFKDNSIRVLTKTLKEESNYNFNTFWNMEAEVKKINGNSNAVNIADMDITWLGNVFIVLDTLGNFYLFQLHIVPELSSPLTVSYAVSQLEYCLVTGLDWWDLTISMRPTMLEAVCERFTDNFQKQPQAVQQNEYCKFLSIKASLYRMLSNGHSKNIDFVLLMTLYSISTAFKSLLRPSDLSSPDKGPGEKLENVLVDSITDVDTVLVSLEAKEFTVEPSTLQSLQQLIQWVAHLSLNILARVPEHRKTNGYDIVTDVQALNMLRELLVIIRIWGLLRSSCLPIFIRNVDNFDGISTLFRLISRLVQCNQMTEIDESLIDDCCLLQNQVLIPMLNSVPREVCDVASPAFYFQSLPIQFSFGLEPESFVYELETVNLDGGLQTTQNSDIIRHVYLGKYPSVMKQCNRCEGKTQVVSNAKTAAIRSWENRWVKTCVCGGKWRYVHSRPPVYSRKPWIMSRSQYSK